VSSTCGRSASATADASDASRPCGSGVSSDLVLPRVLEATIVLLRHGESTLIAEGRFQGRLDPPLTPLGERQAARAAARLAEPATAPTLPLAPTSPVAVVHSSLQRAARTAELAAEALTHARRDAIAVRSDPRLAELGQGRWEGRTRAEILAADGAGLAAWRRTPLTSNAPEGERVVDAAERVRTALVDVLAELGRAGTANGLTRAAREGSAVAGYPGSPRWSTAPWTLLVGHDGIFKIVLLELLGLPLERFWVFPFALCGISIVEFRDGEAVLRAHNLSEHVADLGPGATSGEPPGRL